MRIYLNSLKHEQENIFEEDVVFDSNYKCVFPLVSVNKAHAKVIAYLFKNFVNIKITLKSNITVTSAYSLKNFDLELNSSDELNFGKKEDENDDIIDLNCNYIDLDKYLFDLLNVSIPMSPKEKGETLPSDGEGYTILSEDDFSKRKKESYNSSFDKLKDINFD